MQADQSAKKARGGPYVMNDNSTAHEAPVVSYPGSFPLTTRAWVQGYSYVCMHVSIAPYEQVHRKSFSHVSVIYSLIAMVTNGHQR